MSTLFARPARPHELDAAEERMARELASRQWRALGSHNHYYLALALPSFKADLVRQVASGVTLPFIARARGVTLERIEDELLAAMTRLRSFSDIHPTWLPWFVEYQTRIKANPSTGVVFR